MITVINADTLRQRVWELADTEPDPYDVAKKLREELTPEHFDLVMAVAFPAWVHKIMTYMPPKTTAEPAPDPVLYDDGHGGKTPNPNKAAAASWYGNRLRLSVLTASGYIPFARCTAEQVDYLAERRKIKALEDLAAAERYAKFAQAMRDNGVNIVEELHADIGEPILRGH